MRFDTEADEAPTARREHHRAYATEITHVPVLAGFLFQLSFLSQAAGKSRDRSSRLNTVVLTATPGPRREASMLSMRWHCRIAFWTGRSPDADALTAEI